MIACVLLLLLLLLPLPLLAAAAVAPAAAMRLLMSESDLNVKFVGNCLHFLWQAIDCSGRMFQSWSISIVSPLVHTK